MTPQERDLLIQMFQRIDAAGDQPRDREAEELIADAVRQLPFAPYLLAQTVLVQEEALKAAGARIEELEAQVKTQSEPPQGGSFLGAGSALSRPSTTVPSSGSSPWDAMHAMPCKARLNPCSNQSRNSLWRKQPPRLKAVASCAAHWVQRQVLLVACCSPIPFAACSTMATIAMTNSALAAGLIAISTMPAATMLARPI